MRDSVINPSRVLFVVNEHCHYVEFKKILESPSIEGKIKAHFVFDRHVDDPFKMFSVQIAEARKAGHSFSVTHTFLLRQSNHWLIRLTTVLIDLSRSSRLDRMPGITSLRWIPKGIHRLATEFIFYRKRIKLLRRLADKEKIDIVVLGEENVLLDTFIYSRLAKNRPMFIYPYTIPNPDEMVLGSIRIGSWNRLVPRLIYYFGGRWTRRFGTDVYLLLNPIKLAAMYLLGFRPKNPWVLNAGYAEKICVESASMADLYESFDVPSSKIVVTGSLNDDILASIQANRDRQYEDFITKYGLERRPIVLIALPPNQFPVKDSEYQNYDQLLSALADKLHPYLSKYNLVAVRHPRLTRSLEIVESAGITIASEPTINLIPISHLYIASVSATIRWAIASKLPVINYDMYRYRYRDYSNVPGVLTVFDLESFSKSLSELLGDEDKFNRIREAQASVSSHWGLIDGQSGKRFLNTILGAT